MSRPEQNQTWNFSINRSVAAVALAVLFVLTGAAIQSLQAQTFTVLHGFKGQADGAYPRAGLTMDRAGNLYGTTAGAQEFDGNCELGCGTVFKMVRKGSGWIFVPLYDFSGGADGRTPVAKVIVGPDGSLYGTTLNGGQGLCQYGTGCGVVFNLRPPASACKAALCPWTETVLYRFVGGADGGQPGELAFDQAGNLYGTASWGGYTGGGGNCQQLGCGVIFKLTPSNGGWAESTIYTFMGGADGAYPVGPLIPDASGNLYGVTEVGGAFYCSFGSEDCGTIFRLSPSQSGWTKTTLYSFQEDSGGYFPYGGLTVDGAGNLYGTTTSGGTGGGGTVFEFTPSGASGVFSLVDGLTGQYQGGPSGPLVLDQAGNLYGAQVRNGAHNFGSVFKLTRHNGFWLFTDLYDFFSASDGALPYDGLALDAQGNIYGTTEGNGAGPGTVFEITP
jgi:uncharacterized repeat protein (TIGR03803 family)